MRVITKQKKTGQLTYPDPVYIIAQPVQDTLTVRLCYHTHGKLIFNCRLKYPPTQTYTVKNDYPKHGNREQICGVKRELPCRLSKVYNSMAVYRFYHVQGLYFFAKYCATFFLNNYYCVILCTHLKCKVNTPDGTDGSSLFTRLNCNFYQIHAGYHFSHVLCNFVYSKWCKN